MKKLLVSFTFLLHFTLSAQTPGNVGTANLTAWFKADDLSLGNVTAWTTAFPTGGSAITVSDASAPYPQLTVSPAHFAANYNKTIDFGSNTVASLMALQNTSALNLLDNSLSSHEGSFFSSYLLPASASCGGCHVINYRESGGDGIQFRASLGALGRLAIGTGNSTNASRDFAQTNNRDIISYTGNKATSTSMTAYERDHVFTGGVSSSSTGDVGLFIGVRRQTSYNAPFDGYINELIFYNRTLTPAEANRVHSYLAMKYGTTLENTGGGTNGDYSSSSGTLIWDASLSSTYHNDVIALSRDDNQGLLQKQSHSFDDTTRVYLSSLAAWNGLNTANAASFGSNESFLVLGHNQGKMCSTSGSALEVPAACMLYSRLEREWKLTKTNFTSNFNMDFTLNGCAAPSSVNIADLRVLIDDDGDFSNGGTTCYFNGDGSGIVISYSNPIITVSNISAAMIPNGSTRYLTIASIQQITPLPVELLAFDVEKISDRRVDVFWSTASEQNSDYFEVQRSADITNWETVKEVKAMGTTYSTTNYSVQDDNPLYGTSYYRLKQFDLNGDYELSEVRLVSNIQGQNDIILYPNPTKEKVILRSSENFSMNAIHILDATGRVLHEITCDTNLLEVNVENLSSGAYTLIVTDAQGHTQSLFLLKD